jgi:DNA-binding FadR family transcriptional regulator
VAVASSNSKKRDPIPRRKLSHEIKDRLVKIIESGELRPGDKMPSEQVLVGMFQVGRPAVREAMQALENMGLLSINHGERAMVRIPTAQGIIEQMDLATREMLMNSYENVQHLQEARQMFEFIQCEARGSDTP